MTLMFALRRLRTALIPSLLLLLTACTGAVADPAASAAGDLWMQVCREEVPKVVAEDLGRAVVPNVSVMLTDVSKSTEDERDAFREGLCATASEILANGGTLYGGRISSGGVQEGFELLGTFDLTRPSECSNDLICVSKKNEERRVAADAVASWIDSSVGEVAEDRGTDVHSAIDEAARILRNADGASCLRIMVFSDMVERPSEEGELPPVEAVEGALAGIHVQVVGAGVTTSSVSAARARELKSLWDEYFLTTGATYDPMRDYGPSFLRLTDC